jgi:hypothetical protein
VDGVNVRSFLGVVINGFAMGSFSTVHTWDMAAGNGSISCLIDLPGHG